MRAIVSLSSVSILSQACRRAKPSADGARTGRTRSVGTPKRCADEGARVRGDAARTVDQGPCRTAARAEGPAERDTKRVRAQEGRAPEETRRARTRSHRRSANEGPRRTQCVCYPRATRNLRSPELNRPSCRLPPPPNETIGPREAARARKIEIFRADRRLTVLNEADLSEI